MKRVGGRTQGHFYENYQYDIGGQWLGPGNDRVYSLLKQFGISTFLQYDQGASVTLIRTSQKPNVQERLVVNESTNAAQSSGVSAVYPLYMINFMNDIEKLSRDIDVNAPWQHPNAKEWDSISCYDWKVKQYGDEIAQKLNAEQGLLVTNPKKVSFLFWLYFCKMGNGLLNLGNTTNGAQQDRYVV